MQFSAVAFFIAAISALAVASPAQVEIRTGRLALRQLAGLCPGIDSPLCCETDVDGVADLTCAPPSTMPKSTSDFVKICSKSGLTAECCLLDADGDGLVCTAQA